MRTQVFDQHHGKRFDVGVFVHPWVRRGKRVFDVLGGLALLSFSLPLWPWIALAIKLESPGPVLFRQLRIGQSLADRTVLFRMIKFRSMRADAEADGRAVWASKQDARITRVGHFLRKTRLDELPQLINVLKGEMSLIGPRPERPGLFRTLDEAIPFYGERIYAMPPGVTGLAQVHQGYDETLDDVRNKLNYDHAYAFSMSRVRHWLNMDVHVIWRTVLVMVCGRGQ